MAKHRILRLDVSSGNRDNSQVKSAMYFKDGVKAAVDNATFVAIKGLLEGEREIHEVVDVTDADVYVGVISTPEVMADQKGVGDMDLGNFFNEADEPVRVHVLHDGDTLSIANGDKKEDFNVGAKLVAKHIQTETVGRYVYEVFELQAQA